MIKISVITATYNRLEYLKDCIKSVQSQIIWPLNDINFEHIVVDDHSSDNTENFMKTVKVKNLYYYRLEKNIGAAGARNFGIEKSSGSWICLLDSDDVYLQRTIYNFALGIKTNNLSNWFTTDFISADEKLRYILQNDYYSVDFDSIQDELAAIFNKNHFIQGNVCFSKEIFYQVGGYDSKIKIGEDIDLYTRFLLSNYKDKHLNFISHIHRHHNNNISLQISLKNREDIKELRKKYRNIINERKIQITNE